MESPDDVKELVEQAREKHRRSDILRIVLIVATVAAAGGSVLHNALEQC